jgi:hypothetical protein
MRQGIGAVVGFPLPLIFAALYGTGFPAGIIKVTTKH